MKFERLLQQVEPAWRDSFLRFVETGNAEDEFLEYLNYDGTAQHAVQSAFDAQAAAFEGLAQELRNPSKALIPAIEPAAIAYTKIAEAIECVSQLPLDQRNDVVAKATPFLASIGIK